jgi:hypothetical protein
MNALYCELLMLPEIFICFRNVGETHFVDGIGLDNKMVRVTGWLP